MRGIQMGPLVFAASHYLARTLNGNQVPLLFRASAMNEQQFTFCSEVFQSVFVNFTRERMNEWKKIGPHADEDVPHL